MDNNDSPIISLGLVAAIAKKIAIKYESVGITNIRINNAGNGITFELDTGDSYDIAFNASNIPYNNSVSGILADNVKSALDEIVENLSEYATTVYVDEQNDEYIGREQQVDFDAIISEGNEIVGSLESSIRNFEFVNNTGYLIYVKLPITTYTGDLSNEYPISFLDKDGNVITTNCIFNTDPDRSSSVGDFCQIQRYNPTIGYEWAFYAHYSEYMENDVLHRVLYSDTPIRESNSALDGDSIYAGVINSTFKIGTVIICTSDYTSGTYSYMKGHSYLINGSWTGGILSISTEDITPTEYGTYVLQLSNEEMLDAVTNGGFIDGQYAIPMDDDGYIIGNLYQFKITAVGQQENYSWVSKERTIGDVVGGTSTVLNSQSSLTISEQGTYIILGDCGALNITAVAPVTVSVLGTIGALTLPNSTKTILLKSTGYTGSLDLTVSTNTSSLADGSIVGKYQIRCTDVQ